MLYRLDVPQCQHIKEDGIRCGSPALRGQPLCFQHNRIYHPRVTPGQRGYQFPAFETHAATTLTIRQVLQAVHDGQLDLARGRFFLYGLQIAAPYVKYVAPYCDNVSTELTPAMQDRLRSEDSSSASVADAGVGEPINNKQSTIENSPAAPPASVADAAVVEPINNKQSTIENSPGQSSLSDLHSEIRSSIFHPDPEKVRAYWTQHLTPQQANLRSPSGSLIYEPPTWLPLTDEQLAYLRGHLPPDNARGTAEEQENLKRMSLHCSHCMIQPPTYEKLRGWFADAWKNRSQDVAAELSALLKKPPQQAVPPPKEDLGS